MSKLPAASAASAQSNGGTSSGASSGGTHRHQTTATTGASASSMSQDPSHPDGLSSLASNIPHPGLLSTSAVAAASSTDQSHGSAGKYNFLLFFFYDQMENDRKTVVVCGNADYFDSTASFKFKIDSKRIK